MGRQRTERGFACALGRVSCSLRATFIVGLALLVLVIVAVSNAVTVINADERAVLTVLGEQQRVLEPGMNIVPPFVSQVHRFTLSEQQIEVGAEALSADDIPTTVEATLTLTVEDPEQAFEAVQDYERALRDQCRDLLRERIGRVSHRELAGDRRSLALGLRDDLDGYANEWGIRVRSVEVTTVERTD